MDSAERLQGILHGEIPLTNAIGIRVIRATESSVTLTAPLDKNINHKSTAFGGSLYSVAVLAGWGLIWVRLQAMELSAHIVIQQSDVQYLQPVTRDIEATCAIQSEDAFRRFIQIFTRKGASRIALNVEIAGNGGAAVRFSGKYVIHR